MFDRFYLEISCIRTQGVLGNIKIALLCLILPDNPDSDGGRRADQIGITDIDHRRNHRISRRKDRVTHKRNVLITKKD